MRMKRKLEVFSAGCSRCEETISRIKDPACPDCEVVVVNMHEAEGNRRAKELDVRTVPAVAIDGQSCHSGLIVSQNMSSKFNAAIDIDIEPQEFCALKSRLEVMNAVFSSVS
jgi:glutaredoxin 3